MGAQCNSTSNVPTVGSAIEITHATDFTGRIFEQIVTTDAIYFSMATGEGMKIYWNTSIAWAIDYGEEAWSMSISADSTFLIVSTYIWSYPYLGKLDSSTGNVLLSYSTSTNQIYFYIHTSDERALSIHYFGWF